MCILREMESFGEEVAGGRGRRGGGEKVYIFIFVNVVFFKFQL